MSGENAVLVGANRCDLTEWNLPFGDLADRISATVAEVMNEALESDEGARVAMPFIYAGADGVCDGYGIEGDPARPLTIRVSLPFTGEQFNDVYLDADLREVLVDTMEQARVDGSWREGLAAIGAALRQLAEEVEAAAAEGEKAYLAHCAQWGGTP